jgi:hypothetical protein
MPFGQLVLAQANSQRKKYLDTTRKLRQALEPELAAVNGCARQKAGGRKGETEGCPSSPQKRGHPKASS